MHARAPWLGLGLGLDPYPYPSPNPNPNPNQDYDPYTTLFAKGRTDIKRE